MKSPKKPANISSVPGGNAARDKAVRGTSASRHPWRSAFCIGLAAAFSFGTGPARAAAVQPPCTMAAMPAYPAADAAPVIAVWHGKDLEQGNRQPPLCTGWPAELRSRLIVTLTGSFRFDGPMSVLLARIGTISALPRIRYWSASDKKWTPLSNDASALTAPDANARRRDFSAAELVKGASLYYWEDDTRTGPAIYRLRVSESAPERFVVSSDNVTPIRRFWFTLFNPGALQSVLVVEHVAPDVFGVSILNRSGADSSVLTAGHESSYVNRATALYRQLAGIKTDQEPPAAP